jgi:cytochrome c biogenesis factor
VAELGELSLWAALPLLVLAAVASIGGGWTGRGDLAAMGGRAARSAAALLFISLAGLAYALITVQLRYSYVAAFSGFQEPRAWRLAALWSGPAAGALVFTFLIASSAALSYRLGRSRQGSARTGSLAVLALIGLATVLTRAVPFAQPEAPAQVGLGLPLAVKDLAWQVEVVAVYLAIACGAFSFAGVVGEQLAETRRGQHPERAAITLSAGLLTLAILAATWRAYAASGRLLDVTGLSYVAVHVPAWLLAVASLHAPGGRAVPGWAARWSRILDVAFFPAVMGAGAAVLVGMGEVPPATLWAGGFAVGIVSGALSVMTRREPGVEWLRRVPGFGAGAFQGGLLSLGFAGMAAVWAWVKGPAWASITWPVVMLGLAAAAAWSTSRPAGSWKKVWPSATVLAVASAVGVYALSGWRLPELAITVGLAVAILFGFAADLVRLRAARRSWGEASSEHRPDERAVARARAGRRWSSALGHLGVAILVVGLSAEKLAEVRTAQLNPGDSITTGGGLASEVRVTYLGLSNYQVGELDKRVASFTLSGLGTAPELVTAALTYDLATRRQFRTPALKRGALSDVVVGITGRTGSEEGIMFSVASRPLASLVWLGGLLLLAAIFARGRVTG